MTMGGCLGFTLCLCSDPIRGKQALNREYPFFFLTHPRSFCMLSLESIQGVRILLAPVMKLVDMQVLGTCAVRCVGSSPTGGNYLRSMYSTSFILALESGRFFCVEEALLNEVRSSILAAFFSNTL